MGGGVQYYKGHHLNYSQKTKMLLYMTLLFMQRFCKLFRLWSLDNSRAHKGLKVDVGL